MPYIDDPNNPGFALYVDAADPRLAAAVAAGEWASAPAEILQQYGPTSPTTTISAEDVARLFIQYGVDPGTTYSGPGTENRTPEVRYAEIAAAINAGTTDIATVSGHLLYMATNFPMAPVSTPYNVGLTSPETTDPFEWPTYVPPDPFTPEPPAPAPAPAPAPEPPAPYRAPESLVRSMVEWMPAELVEAFVEGYVETGSFELAREAVRGHDAYDIYFPGNRRDDGSLRYSEEQYLGIVEGFEDALLGININPEHFTTQFGELVAGLVSPNEFRGRVDELYTRVIGTVEPIREFYALNYGIGLTDSAIVASIIDPDIGDAIISERIAISEIGGEARLHEFGINLDLATQLYQRGLSRRQAGDIFTQAAAELPILDVLAARHEDPDDDFDLNDFLKASVFGDPEERRRIRRLLASERSMFATPARFRTEGAGAITGLREF